MIQVEQSLVTVERERERESCSLEVTAFLTCIKVKISYLASKLHIIYREVKVDIQLEH